MHNNLQKFIGRAGIKLPARETKPSARSLCATDNSFFEIGFFPRKRSPPTQSPSTKDGHRAGNSRSLFKQQFIMITKQQIGRLVISQPAPRSSTLYPVREMPEDRLL